MTKKRNDITVGPWAKEKLDSLDRYLNYYTTRLKNQTWCRGTFFIDAFAGPGVSPVRDSQSEVRVGGDTPDLFGPRSEDPRQAETEFVRRSPRVALGLKNRFSDYIFIERDPDRLAALRELQHEPDFAGLRIEVLDGDANVELVQFLSRPVDWRTHRGVVFLDPFGMQVPWTTIEAIAKTRGLEVLINFPFGMAINRLLTVSGDIPRSWEHRLDTAFGSPEWRDLVYETANDLAGTRKVKRADAAERVLGWFSERLRTAFGHASRAQLIKNTKGNPLYYLIWAGPHAAGLEGANYILGLKHKAKRQKK